MSESTDNPTLDVEAIRERHEVALRWLREGYSYDDNFNQAALLIRDDLPALLAKLDEIDRARDHAEFEADQLRMESRRLGDQANHLVQQVNAACAARQRIAEAHHKHVDAHGGTYGECNECSNAWPCPTYVWATTERDPLATWDPADDAAPAVAVPDAGSGETTDGEVAR